LAEPIAHAIRGADALVKLTFNPAKVPLDEAAQF
jgi:hypothetical protein